jgi:hypothetical protein
MIKPITKKEDNITYNFTLFIEGEVNVIKLAEKLKRKFYPISFNVVY